MSTYQRSGQPIQNLTSHGASSSFQTLNHSSSSRAIFTHNIQKPATAIPIASRPQHLLPVATTTVSSSRVLIPQQTVYQQSIVGPQVRVAPAAIPTAVIGPHITVQSAASPIPFSLQAGQTWQAKYNTLYQAYLDLLARRESERSSITQLAEIERLKIENRRLQEQLAFSQGPALSDSYLEQFIEGLIQRYRVATLRETTLFFDRFRIEGEREVHNENRHSQRPTNNY